MSNNAQAGQGAAGGAQLALPAGATMNLVKDIPVTLSIELGRTRMSLKDLLELEQEQNKEAAAIEERRRQLEERDAQERQRHARHLCWDVPRHHLRRVPVEWRQRVGSLIAQRRQEQLARPLDQGERLARSLGLRFFFQARDQCLQVIPEGSQPGGMVLGTRVGVRLEPSEAAGDVAHDVV